MRTKHWLFLARLQQFNPPGVFARDLKECLTLQLRDRNRFDPAMQKLLDHLPLVAARNIAAANHRVRSREQDRCVQLTTECRAPARRAR